MTSDSERWDARYEQATPPTTLRPHPIVIAATASISAPGKAADIACGWGDGGLFLADRGMDVTFFDISAVALQQVQNRVAQRGNNATTVVYDTAMSGAPAGPWDFITCVHYLDRPMLGQIANELAPGGVLAVAIATQINLERHQRPSARFLLEPGELHDLVLADSSDVAVNASNEAWRDSGVHEAWLIAQRGS